MLGLELLTSAFGVLTCIRGLSAFLGPPLGGFAIDATSPQVNATNQQLNATLVTDLAQVRSLVFPLRLLQCDCHWFLMTGDQWK